MKIHQRHTQRIAHIIVALNVMAERTDDEKQAKLLTDAAFYLMELSVKHVWPEAQSLIEDYSQPLQPSGITNHNHKENADDDSYSASR